MNYGLVNSVLRSVNIQPVEWLTQAIPLKIVLIILLLWRWLGWNIVINLAGLQTIPHEYYEAAVVDGANRFQIFLRITIPLMKQVILYTTITTIIGTLQLFAEPRLLTTAAGILGGRNNSLLTPVMYIYQMGFGYFRFGYASAIAYVFFVIVLGASILNLKFINQKD